MLRFLADESCDYAVVRALTSRGHEVLLVAELSLQVRFRRSRTAVTEASAAGMENAAMVDRARTSGDDPASTH